MLNLLILLAAAYCLFLLARVFRKTLKTVENPEFVMEKPPMPKDTAAALRTADRWRSHGRISREEHERLLRLCLEDAETDDKKRKNN